MPRLGPLFISSILLISIALTTAGGFILASYRAAAHSACRLVSENYFRAGEERVRDWVRRCEKSADRESFVMDPDVEVGRINHRLSLLEVSHMSLYSPTENRQLWENEALDTGLRGRMIEGELVIYAVLEGGAGESAGIQPGDVVMSVDHIAPQNPFDIQSQAGVYEFNRRDKIFQKEIEPTDLTENRAPYLVAVLPTQPNVGLLRIPSFLAQYFDKKDWQELTKAMMSYPALIIDLRGNSGGSFPAMLRALSPFRCALPKIGTLFHSSRQRGLAILPDDLDASLQLEQLKLSNEVQLRAFKDYGCYQNPVTLLIDNDTSSVAEIFTHAFYLRPHSRVWGQPSAGQVVMAQWFQIPALGGDDYSLSIPIAGYRSLDGVELENQGLKPQRLLNYDLDRAKVGRDSWLEDALKR